MSNGANRSGDRYNSGKPRWGLLDFDVLEGLVRVIEHGTEKYDIDNWKKGLGYEGVAESLLRHVFAFLKGEENDSESGLPHVDHIQANAMILAYMAKYRKEFDDRRIDVAKSTWKMENVGAGDGNDDILSDLMAERADENIRI